jgi:hypothetical protein
MLHSFGNRVDFGDEILRDQTMYGIFYNIECRAYLIHSRRTLSNPTSHFLNTFSSLIPAFYMPRTRDIMVPNAVQGIEEVVIRHTKTKRGTVRTTEKVVPVLKPPNKKSGQPSRSKKRPQPQSQPDGAEGSGRAIPAIETDDTQTHPFVDEQEYDIPDVAAEDTRPQATVCIGLYLHGMVKLSRCRPQ